MATATHHHDIVSPDIAAARLSVRAARIGLVAVLVAALALGVVSLRYGSNTDPAVDTSAVILTNR